MGSARGQLLKEWVAARGEFAEVRDRLELGVRLTQGEEDGFFDFLGQDLCVLAVAVKDARGAHGRRVAAGLAQGLPTP